MQKWLSKIKDALLKTRRVVAYYDPTTINNEPIIDLNDEFYDNLLEKFIKADVGIDLSEIIIPNVKSQIKNEKINKNDLHNKLKEVIKNTIGTVSSHPYIQHDINKLNVLLIVGVNGSGKTTSIGKLAKKFKDEGFKVLIVAGDTFRAAAGGQLSIWASRAQVEIFSPGEIKKPDAIVFSAIEKAKKENYNLLLIDTAGRLHSQTNLMEELKKIDGVIEKQVRVSHATPQHYEKLIVLDATIGQNAIIQAELFSKATPLTGIILAKLDSSAKGGVVLNIMNKLSLAVRFIGTGEKIDDLVDFNLDEYLEGLIL